MIKLLFIQVLFMSYLFAQTQWYWQNPGPIGADLGSVYFLNSEVGWTSAYESEWVSDYCKKIYKTIDGGRTWSSLDIDDSSFIDIDFINENIGYMLTNNNIFKTINGGNSWQKILAGTIKYFCFKFIDEDNGYLASRRFVFKTINGGVTWNAITTYLDFDIKSIWCDNKNITVVGGNNKIKKSTDGGITWINQISLYETNLKKVFYIYEKTGFIVGENDEQGKIGCIQKTTNGGETWNIKLMANIKDIYFLDSLLGFAYGKNISDGTFTCLKTTDSGENWQLINLFNSSVKKMFFLDEDKYFAVGEGGYLSKTIDRGNNWSPLFHYLYRGPLKQISFATKFGIAGGSGYGVLITRDKGINWDTSLTSTLITHIDVINDLNAVALNNQELYRTSDAGETWQKKEIGNLFEFPGCVDASFTDVNNGLLLKDGSAYPKVEAAVVRTKNGGESWSESSLRDIYLAESIFMIDSLIAYAVGMTSQLSKGVILKTYDGGLNWEFIYSFAGEYLFDISFANKSNGVVVGSYNDKIVVLRTTNSGDTWSKNIIETDLRVEPKVSYPDVNNCIISVFPELYKTNDGGNTWHKENQTLWDGDIYYVDARTGYATGLNGLLYNRNGYWSILSTIDFNNPPTSVEENFVTQVNTYSLSQNYPNPFNPTTKINYTIAKGGNASLIIYDVLGREVKKLFDEEKSKGNYTIEFNASVLSSGIYFYRLQVDGFAETKKMVLMK